MIILRLQGGLGNQLFQFLAYQRICEIYKDVYLDITDYNLPYNNGYRKFDLDSFTTNKLKFVLFCDSLNKKIKYNLLHRNIHVMGYAIKNTLQYMDCTNTMLLSDNLNEIKDNCYVEGWFTNERFISDWSNNNFYFKKTIFQNQSIKKAYDLISKSNSVSIHIRRTDYITENERYGGICTLEYYQKAIDFFRKNNDKPIFYIFSDDIKWCKENFASEDIIFVDDNLVTKKNSSVEDLFLMSCCKHNIIANSTYSWWGAAFNKNPGKIVIRPTRWSNDNDGTNIYQKEWILIE